MKTSKPSFRFASKGELRKQVTYLRDQLERTDRRRKIAESKVDELNEFIRDHSIGVKRTSL